MPQISVVIIRTALLQFGFGATIGGLLLAEKGLHLLPWLWLLRQAHIHMMLLGWIVQLACGVAIWILPRLDAAGDRGRLELAWLGYLAINAGILLAGLHLPAVHLFGAEASDWMPAAAALCDALAVVTMVAVLWRRVLPFRSFADTKESV